MNTFKNEFRNKQLQVLKKQYKWDQMTAAAFGSSEVIKQMLNGIIIFEQIMWIKNKF